MYTLRLTEDEIAQLRECVWMAFQGKMLSNDERQHLLARLGQTTMGCNIVGENTSSGCQIDY